MAPRRTLERLLGTPPLPQQPLELLVLPPPLVLGFGATTFELGHARLEPRERGGAELDAQRLDLVAEPLGPLCRRCLERQRPQPLTRLLLERPRPVDLDGDPLQLELGPVAALLEAAETGRLLDERAPFGGLRREHLLDPALPDDGVQLVAEAGVGEQLEHVRAADGRAVDQVLALTAALKPARDRKLGERQRAVARRVVEQQLHLAVIRSREAATAREQDVLGLLGPQRARREASRGPDDRVRHVRLARAVRPDDHGHPRLEANLDRFRERLEAAQPDGAQVHAARS